MARKTVQILEVPKVFQRLMLKGPDIFQKKMSRPVIPDVTLASADPAILQCWEEKVRQGAKCSLLLKHSNGKIETILKSTSMSAKPKVQSYAPPASSPVEKKKRSKGSKKTRLDALLAYHQRLVVEKGMPPEACC